MRASKNQFNFKQFTIQQDQCAMKVCTDSCIFGAFVPPYAAQKILDIGTGSGLLSLMLAQRSSATITSIEINQSAAFQAHENIKNSPWTENVEIFHTSLQDFCQLTDQKFDLIISNPPFFSQNLKSPIESINVARHSDTLTFENLAAGVIQLLDDDGIFWVLLPEYEMDLLSKILSEKGLFQQSALIIRNTTSGPVFRVIASFSTKKYADIQISALVIKNDQDQYTEAFVDLLLPYYLYL